MLNEFKVVRSLQASKPFVLCCCLFSMNRTAVWLALRLCCVVSLFLVFLCLRTSLLYIVLDLVKSHLITHTTVPELLILLEACSRWMWVWR